MGEYGVVILLTAVSFCGMILLLAAKPRFASRLTGFCIAMAAVGGLFWMKQPLNASEETVLLIGSGRYAGQILERGLVMNIRAPEQHIGYHLFGHGDARNLSCLRRQCPGLGAA